MEKFNYLVRYISSSGAKLNTSALHIMRPCKIGDLVPVANGLYAKIIAKI